jgi:hypothetical protein
MSDSVGTAGTTITNHHLMILAAGGETPAFQKGMYKNMFNGKKIYIALLCNE